MITCTGDRQRPGRRWGSVAGEVISVLVMVMSLGNGLGLLPAAAEPPVTPVSGAGAVDTEAVDRFIEEQMDKHGLPGVSLAIFDDNHVAYSQGYGSAGGYRSMADTTPMYVGSITKPFTAVTVLQLAEQDLVDLDSPVQRYLPQFEVADPAVSAEITVRDLLAHTSGLSELGYRRVLDPGASLEDAVRDLRHAEPTAAPGEQHQYFNPNYAVAARLVEVVTGRSFADVVQDRILTPLDMTSSTADPEDAPDGLAQGYVSLFGFAAPREAPVRRYRDGAGNVISTATDLAAFAMAVGLQGAESGLLSEESLEAMRTPPDLDGVTYDLGWQLAEQSGEQVGWHDGLDPTYSGQLVVLPERGVGYALLVNQGHLGTTMVAFPQLRDGMIDLLSGRDANVDGIGWRWIGFGLLAVFAGVVFFGVRSLVRLPSWPPRARQLSRGKCAWAIGSHLLTAALVVLLMYVFVPMLLGRAFNLVEVGQFHLPDLTLILAVSVVADLVVAAAMATILRAAPDSKPMVRVAGRPPSHPAPRRRPALWPCADRRTPPRTGRTELENRGER